MYRVSDAPVVHFLYFTRIKVVASFNRDSTYDRKNSEQRKKKKNLSDGGNDREKLAAVENSSTGSLKLLTLCSCLKSSSCSTENQSIPVLISNQKSVMASQVIVCVPASEVIPQMTSCGYSSSLFALSQHVTQPQLQYKF